MTQQMTNQPATGLLCNAESVVFSGSIVATFSCSNLVMPHTGSYYITNYYP